ncbi:MAG: cytochrome P450 [bacterium]|nr:cytochrome P450 [bacterium]
MVQSISAPPVSGFVCDPHSAFYQAHLYEIYRTLRDEFPVYYSEMHDLRIVSRYADVRSILLDHDTFTVNGVAESKQLPPMLVYLDGERHTKLRNLISRGFTPRRIAAMEGRIRAITRKLLDDLAGESVVDLMHSFAAQLPSRVVAELIGIPEERREIFLECTEGMIETGPKEHQITEPAKLIFAEFDELLAQRRKERRDDLMSALIDAEIDGKRVTAEELMGFCFLLIIGGNDTTMNLIGNGIALLAWHPEQRAELVRDVSLIPGAVEEMLRVEAPTQALARRPTRDVELHGVTIPADSRVLINYGSANHDDRVFEDSDLFDIHRPEIRHLSLGQGSHYCMGSSLARMESRIAFEELLERYPEYQLESEPDWVTSRWARSHPELEVRLQPTSQ